jgi:hypothetical protein
MPPLHLEVMTQQAPALALLALVTYASCGPLHLLPVLPALCCADGCVGAGRVHVQHAGLRCHHCCLSGARHDRGRSHACKHDVCPGSHMRVT